MKIATILLLPVILLLSSCTMDSTRIAINAQRRSAEVTQTVIDNQHKLLTTLAYRVLKSQLESDIPNGLTPAALETLSEYWNVRDQVEFLLLQHEKSKAIRIVGVDTKLYADQGILNLLYKAVSQGFESTITDAPGEIP